MAASLVDILTKGVERNLQDGKAHLQFNHLLRSGEDTADVGQVRFSIRIMQTEVRHAEQSKTYVKGWQAIPAYTIMRPAYNPQNKGQHVPLYGITEWGIGAYGGSTLHHATQSTAQLLEAARVPQEVVLEAILNMEGTTSYPALAYKNAIQQAGHAMAKLYHGVYKSEIVSSDVFHNPREPGVDYRFVVQEKPAPQHDGRLKFAIHLYLVGTRKRTKEVVHLRRWIDGEVNKAYGPYAEFDSAAFDPKEVEEATKAFHPLEQFGLISNKRSLNLTILPSQRPYQDAQYSDQ